MVAAHVAPGPKTLWPGGHLFYFRRDPLNLLTRLAREFGDVVQFRAGTQRVFLLNHPEHVRDVLVTHHGRFHTGRALQRAKRLLGEGLLTSEGEFHRRQRRLAQPAFHRQRVGAYARVMTEFAAKTSARWRDGQTLDVSEEMMRLTLSIVGKTLFDADVESDADEVGAALTEVMNLFGYLMLPFSELLEKLPLPQRRRFERARARLDRVIYRIIEERRRSGEDRGDLLSMLLLAVDEEGDRGRMTDEQLRDEAMTLFLAGHETTANALAWSMYLIANVPEVQERARVEAAAALAGDVATLPERLPYLRRILDEALRLYPPAPRFDREAADDDRLGELVVRKGDIVSIWPWLIHRHRRLWDDPDAFDPDRFAPGREAERHRFQYIPFGGGPRTCVGMRFAITEALVILAHWLAARRYAPAPGRPVEPLGTVTLRPQGGLWLDVSPC